MPKMIKNKYLQAGLILSVLLISSAGRADELHQEDGILSNHSTEYVRTLNRNTSTDPDAAFYNQAGLAFMEKNGLYINFSSQTYYVKKTHTLDFYGLKIGTGALDTPTYKKSYFQGTMPDEYMAELTAPCLPGLDIVWKQDKWAAFFDLAVMQAATPMTYRQGLAVMDWGSLLNIQVGGAMGAGDELIVYTRNSYAERNEMYIGVTLGGAYQFVNWLSAGGGLRVIHAQGNMKIQMTDVNIVRRNGATYYFGPDSPTELDWNVDTDTEGFGAGIILSTHFRPEGLVPALKGLNATLRFEYYLPMELEKKTNKFMVPEGVELSGNLDIFKDGSPSPDGMTYNSPAGNGSKKLKMTYPPTINLGLSYMLLGWINLLSSGQVTLRQMVDLDGREKDYNIGYQVGCGVEFIFNKQVTLSTGYLYNDFGIKPECRTEADPLLRSHQIGAGGKFTVDDNLEINLGAFFQYFIPATVYQEKEVQGSSVYVNYMRKDLKEVRYSVSLGATYRMFGSSSGSDFEDDEDDVKTGKKNKKKDS